MGYPRGRALQVFSIAMMEGELLGLSQKNLKDAQGRTNLLITFIAQFNPTFLASVGMKDGSCIAQVCVLLLELSGARMLKTCHRIRARGESSLSQSRTGSQIEKSSLSIASGEGTGQ